MRSKSWQIGVFLAVCMLPMYSADAVCVNVQDVSVRTVVEGLARSGGINLIVDDTVQGKVTMRLNDVTIDEALQAIADSQDLLYDNQGSIRILTAGHKQGHNRTMHTFHLNYVSPEASKEAVQALIPASEVRVDAGTNTLIVGVTKREASEVQALLDRIDVPPRQVKVEVEVVALNHEAMKELGVDWNWQPWQNGPGKTTSFTYEGQIHAMETQGKARILARPHMLASNGKEARILIGDQVPVLTERNQNGEISTTTEYTDAGIKLTYTPRIHDDDSITASIHAEVSTPILVPEMKAYRIMTRQAQNEVRMKAGKTLIIGGLIDRETIDNLRKVPLLGDIPLIGKLFQSHYKLDKETEIVMMIKADVINL